MTRSIFLVKIASIVFFISNFTSIVFAMEKECSWNEQMHKPGVQIFRDGNWYVCKDGTWEKSDSSTQSDQDNSDNQSDNNRKK